MQRPSSSTILTGSQWFQSLLTGQRCGKYNLFSWEFFLTFLITFVQIKEACGGAGERGRRSAPSALSQDSPNLEKHIKIWHFYTACLWQGSVYKVEHKTTCVLSSNLSLFWSLLALDSSQLRVLVWHGTFGFPQWWACPGTFSTRCIASTLSWIFNRKWMQIVLS